MKCTRCMGTGRCMGPGRMFVDCTLCGDDVINEQSTVAKPAKINKRSASYKKGIQDILKASPSLSKIDAEKLFEDAYYRGD
jgi:hypothetical protein